MIVVLSNTEVSKPGINKANKSQQKNIPSANEGHHMELQYGF